MADLSGFWYGRYAYDKSWSKAVRFDAELTDAGGSISGIITEPNTFDKNAGALLSATFSGFISGSQISFEKTYVGEGDAQHKIAYVGQLNANKTLITGHWRIGKFKGPFDMRREGPVVGVKATTKKAETELEKLLEKTKG